MFRKLVQTLACSAQAVVHVRLGTHHEIWTWSCMVTISSSLDVVMISIGCLRKLNEKLELVQKATLGLVHGSEATVLNRCVAYNDSGLTWEAYPRHAELAVAELGLQSARPRAQAVPSRVHHLTTRNWSLTGRKPTKVCQRDWHIWHQADPTSHSLAKNAAAQSGNQNMRTSHV